MRRFLILTVILGLAAAAAPARAQQGRTLDIYVIDVEGGNATLFVSPTGESLLYDTGNIGAAAARDAGRIMEAINAAGLEQIDHLVITHFHGDHIGGLSELAKRIPIRHFIDHGPNTQPAEAIDAFLNGEYKQLIAKAKHTAVKPGDTIPVNGFDARIVASAGQVLSSALPGAGASNAGPCAASGDEQPDMTENGQSVASLITFGRFRMAYLGDLTRDRERMLMCPNNRLGTVDLLLASHHGQSNSNTPAVVHGLQPRVVIVNNGTRKGGQPETMRLLHTSPRLQDVWQIHFSIISGQEYTVPGLFIANDVDAAPATMPVQPLSPPLMPGPAPPGTVPAPVHDGKAYWFKVSAQQNGDFTVTNTRNNFSKTYAAR